MAKRRDVDDDRRDNRGGGGGGYVRQRWHAGCHLAEREEAEGSGAAAKASLPLNSAGGLRVVAQLHGSRTHVYSELGKENECGLRRGVESPRGAGGSIVGQFEELSSEPGCDRPSL